MEARCLSVADLAARRRWRSSPASALRLLAALGRAGADVGSRRRSIVAAGLEPRPRSPTSSRRRARSAAARQLPRCRARLRLAAIRSRPASSCSRPALSAAGDPRPAPARPAGAAAASTIPEGMPSILVHERLMAHPLLTGAIPVPAEGSVLPDSYGFERGETPRGGAGADAGGDARPSSPAVGEARGRASRSSTARARR